MLRIDIGWAAFAGRANSKHQLQPFLQLLHHRQIPAGRDLQQLIAQKADRIGGWEWNVFMG